MEAEQAAAPIPRYWTSEEHSRYLVGLHVFGIHKPKEISVIVGTRNNRQVANHQQKIFERIIRNTKKHVLNNNREGDVGPDVPMVSNPAMPVNYRRYVPCTWGLILLATTAEELKLGELWQILLIESIYIKSEYFIRLGRKLYNEDIAVIVCQLQRDISA